MLAHELNIRRIPVRRINPAPYNPRIDLKPGDPEYTRLERSLDEFGLVEPLVWNRRTGHLVGGHQRFKILLAKGATHADVSVVNLSPHEGEGPQHRPEQDLGRLGPGQARRPARRALAHAGAGPDPQSEPMRGSK